MYTKRISPFLLTALVCIGFLSCQSPVKVVEDVPVTVTVIVRDGQGNPVTPIPVEAHEGTQEQPGDLLQTAVTNTNGATAFELHIPSNGGNYYFIAGTSATGKVVRYTSLLCRDTTLFIVLEGTPVECNGSITDSITFVDVCANTNGQDYLAVDERRYTSECDEELTVTFTPLNDPAISIASHVYDNDGNEVQGNSFVLPAKGSFSVRIEYTPQAVSTLNEVMEFTAQGAISQWDVTLIITGTAVDCNNCLCTDGVMFIDFGDVVADEDSQVVRQESINTNRSICLRSDVVVKNFTNSSIYQLENTPFATVDPGNAQLVRIRFTPPATGAVTDTLIFETVYPSNGQKCTFLVIVTGRGVRPECCIDEASSTGLTVDHTTSPPTYRIEINTAVQEEGAGTICYYNCGDGGWLELSRPAVTTAEGFTIPAQQYSLQPRSTGGGTACFDVSFLATEQMVWPNGRNSGAGTTVFTTQFTVFGCEPATIEVVATVDTTPTLFSICVFRWDQNRLNGYNFTPAATRGSFIEDPSGEDLATTMFTDILYLSGPNATLSGRVRIRYGWKLIRTGVSNQDDFTYDEIRNWPEYPTLTQNIDQNNPIFEMILYGVYVIQIQRNGQYYYALVRVREISDDGQKQKICFDVVFPI